MDIFMKNAREITSSGLREVSAVMWSIPFERTFSVEQYKDTRALMITSVEGVEWR